MGFKLDQDSGIRGLIRDMLVSHKGERIEVDL